MSKKDKPPTRKGQTKTLYEDCFYCRGEGIRKKGSCERGCCEPFTIESCRWCNGKKTVPVKYKAVLVWQKS